MNGTIEGIRNRKSMRAFEPRAVDPALKEVLLDCAFQAPTAGNQMLYAVVDVTDEALKAELAELCDHQPFIAQAPVVLVFLADGHRWMQAYRAAGLSPRPLGAGDALLCAADALIAAQNVVVAAESLGLGSCYIGDVLENRERMKELLRIPDGAFPAAMLVLGWPTDRQKDRRKPARFEREYVVSENAYRELTDAEIREMHRRQQEKGGRILQDFDAFAKAFCERKFESAFARELNRSAEGYLEDFRKG